MLTFIKVILVILCAGLTIGAIGCSEDNDMPVEEAGNPWTGTWSLETFEGESVEAQIAAAKLIFTAFGINIDISYSDIWTFHIDETWQRDVTLTVDETTESYEVMGTYALSDANYTLTPTSSTIPVEDAEADVDFDTLGSTFGNTDVDTGTWSVEGDTLTLTSDTGKVYGLKKK